LGRKKRWHAAKKNPGTKAGTVFQLRAAMPVTEKRMLVKESNLFDTSAKSFFN
jgi:hypothetical protein